jgi:hypothetical protein
MMERPRLLERLNGRGMGGLIAVLSISCSGVAQRPAAASPTTIHILPIVVTKAEALPVDVLLARGAAALQRGEITTAQELLERCRAGSPPTDIAVRATYLAGLAHDRAGSYPLALSRFGEVATRWQEHELARDASLRQIRLAAHLAQWNLVKSAANEFLANRDTPSPIEEVTLRGSLGLALAELHEVDRAEREVGKAMNVAEEASLDVPGRISVDLARLYYARGEVLRARAEQITFVPLPADFATVLERRCELILAAQDTFSSAMRAYDAHWSVMAGYQVSALYAQLHADIMQIPFPASAKSEEQQQLFLAGMTLRYSVLLRKAFTMIERCLDVAMRTGDSEGWISRLQTAREAMRRAVEEQETHLRAVPYSREQISAAFALIASTAPPVANAPNPSATTGNSDSTGNLRGSQE